MPPPPLDLPRQSPIPPSCVVCTAPRAAVAGPGADLAVVAGAGAGTGAGARVGRIEIGGGADLGAEALDVGRKEAGGVVAEAAAAAAKVEGGAGAGEEKEAEVEVEAEDDGDSGSLIQIGFSLPICQTFS